MSSRILCINEVFKITDYKQFVHQNIIKIVNLNIKYKFNTFYFHINNIKY